MVPKSLVPANCLLRLECLALPEGTCWQVAGKREPAFFFKTLEERYEVGVGWEGGVLGLSGEMREMAGWKWGYELSRLFK